MWATACGTGGDADGAQPTSSGSPSDVTSSGNGRDDAGSSPDADDGSGGLPVLGPSSESFSFVVVSDTVAPGYLPFTESQWALVQSLVGPMTGYAAGGSGGVVAEPTFAEGGGLLRHLSLTIPGRATREIDYRAGWPVKVVEVDGGVGRQTFRRAGQSWVYRSAAAALGNGGAAFLLHAGDLSFWGLQGRAADDNPYWRDARERLLDRIPAARLKVGDASGGGSGAVRELSGRVLASVGNHEVWGDEDLEGMRGALPALEELGFSADRPVWAFDFGDTRFISLDSEAFVEPGSARRPLDHSAQMTLLRQWLDGALEAGLDRAVVLYHRPSFTLGRVNGLPAATDPHLVLRDYAERLDLLVFNGHVHTTEAFEVEGVRYVVCGSGGSEQELGTRVPRPGYPADSYWAGAPREEEYAWVEVRVDDATARVLLHRMRPSDPDLPETVELFAD